MKRNHIKHLLLFINNTAMTQENGVGYTIYMYTVKGERRKEKGERRKEKGERNNEKKSH